MKCIDFVLKHLNEVLWYSFTKEMIAYSSDYIEIRNSELLC